MGWSWRLRQVGGWPAVVVVDVVGAVGEARMIHVEGRIRRASTWVDDGP